jgi:Fe-Mn family superoxide dismutase
MNIKLTDSQYKKILVNELYKDTYNKATTKAVERGDKELAINFLNHSNEYGTDKELPFEEYVENGYHIRTFPNDVDDMELVWHRDKEDRIVESVGHTDWLLQLDNELPKPLTESVFIPKESYHRIIKGTGDLTVRVKKIIIEEEQTMFKRVRLPYDYSDLKEFVGPDTMWEHYNRHYKGYTDKLNEAFSHRKNPPTDILAIIKNIDKYNSFVRDNAGGYYNHSLFWNYLTPEVTKPSLELSKKIEKDFGTLSKLKKAFTEESIKVFGSGWCWLVYKDGKLKIVSTSNQDNPLMSDLGKPLLGLDVWEHAYYLNYMSNRKKYIKNFWKVVNWDTVSKEFNLVV